ncbi:GntR family transcriptional regulator [Lacrimispora sp.]|uniref:GntR family transcriptional regulator n=1 Tax=Lacrimispora sp. TaxID=2719234 RepID=UPI002897B1CB|nr:GntR family transcriptional regulator [Lacrimispora sp.]
MDINYFKETFQFQTGSNKPLYEQLTSYIKIQIQAGVLKPGEQMLTEQQLCEILNVSRNTVRQSLNRLVDDGLLVRYRGKGSFIADEKIKRQINYLYNFTENMLSLGATPSSVILSYGVEDADAKIKKNLELPQGQTKVFALVRLRCANGVPILYERTYIPYYLCPGIEHINFETTSLYHILDERYKLNLYHATETIEAVLINQTEAKLLECKSKSAGYEINRISHLDSGFIFEFTTSITRADKCVFQMELYKNPSDSKFPVNIERQVHL